MTSSRLSSRVCWVLCLSVLLPASITRLELLLTMLRTGRSSVELAPAPVYGYLHVPGTASGGPGALGADFSQVYFSAQALAHADSPYAPVDPAYRDRLARLPNYPPLTNHLYVPLSRMRYDEALVLHSLGTLGLYLLASSAFLVAWGQARYLAPCAAVTLLFGYLTPVGISHFERGQFDWYVASSYLLGFASLFATRARPGLCLSSGFLGAIKWTSTPFLGAITALGLSGSPKRRLAFLAIPLAFVISILAFLPESLAYWPSLERYDLTAAATPLSYEWLLPKPVAKAIQPLIVLAYCALLLVLPGTGDDRRARLEAVSVPFGLTMAIQAMSFTAQATEYRLVGLLAGVPALLVWIARVESVSATVKATVAWLFAAFLALAFRVLDRLAPIGLEEMPFVYLAFSIALLVVAFRIAIRWAPEERP